MKNKIINCKIEALYPWFVWTVAAGFFFYKYLLQVSPSVMVHDLMVTFKVNGAGLGNLSAFYFYAYLIMQVPVGMMLDKYSPRYLTAAAIFVCAISTLVFANSNSLWLACVSRAFMGGAAAFAAVSCFKLAAIWFPPKRFALVSGMFMTAAMLGAVGGQMPLSILVDSVGWRLALKTISAVGTFWGILYLLTVRDKLPNAQSQPANDASFKSQHNYSLKNIFLNKQTWFLSLYSGLAFAPVSVFGGLWGVPFLQIAYQLSKKQASFAVSTIFIGFGLGAPILGWLSDNMGKRKPILYSGTVIALISLAVIIFGKNINYHILMSLLFIFGFATSGFFTSFAMIREIFPIGIAATVLGFMNTFDSICEAFFEPIVGAVLDYFWDGRIYQGAPYFNLHGYHISLSCLLGSLILSILILFFIEETYCKTKD